MRIALRIAVALLPCAMAGQSGNTRSVDLTQANLEDLMNIRVTSVSKREQSLARTAAAIFVIGQEDIRRSGATNLPDLLRMVPGVDVQQIDANSWAISVRGFNSRYSNKVLVLIDGRSVYTPSFSGVFWEHLDMPLTDIDRIEVIRGPGATVWGANAVNGVISIFTKSSRDTTGGLAIAGAGSETKALGLLQYGGAAGSNATYRVFGKYLDIGNTTHNGREANDHWSQVHGGFRSDWNLSHRDTLLFEGDIFSNDQNQTRPNSLIPIPTDPTFPENFSASGGNLVARWNHSLAGGSETTLETYFDGYRRTDHGVPEVLRNFNLDFQHHVLASDRHELVWGLGYRVYRSAISTRPDLTFLPPSRTDQLFSAFLQDEISLSDSWWLTLGAKLEHNPYTGFQIEPSARLVWSPPGGRQTIWAAASRALRQPSRIDTSMQVVSSTPIGPNLVRTVEFLGNPDIQDEELRDYEAGFRAELSKTFSLDVSAFLSFYQHLETSRPLAPRVLPGPTTEIVAPLLCSNGASAVNYGGEAAATWAVTPRWRVSPGYAYLHANIRLDANSQDLVGSALATGFPEHTLELRSCLNVTRRLEFDQSYYYTARLPGGNIPGHGRLDLRLARTFGERLEISVVGQNLLRGRTLEFGDSFGVIGTEARRSIYGSVTWRF